MAHMWTSIYCCSVIFWKWNPAPLGKAYGKKNVDFYLFVEYLEISVVTAVHASFNHKINKNMQKCSALFVKKENVIYAVACCPTYWYSDMNSKDCAAAFCAILYKFSKYVLYLQNLS